MENVLTQHIEITPGVRGGQPCLAGTHIAVAEIAATYDLPLAGVYAALAYYYDHQAAIDERIAADTAFVAAFRQQNPSKLQARLRDLRGG
jgi:uncharacterized protein (DUF433 family)